MNAKKIANHRTERVGKCTGNFVKKKYTQYMIWFLPAYLSATLLVCVQNGVLKAICEAFCGIPNILLLGSLGFGLDVTTHVGIHVASSWYLSALFLCEIILFPIIIRTYDTYIHIIAPIGGVILMGLTFAGILTLGLVFPKPMCLIILGTMTYEVSEKMNAMEIQIRHRVLLNILSRVVWLAYVLWLCIDGYEEMEYALIFLMMGSLSFIFSKHGHISFFDNKVCLYLGAISVPIYLLHMQVFFWMENCKEKVGWKCPKEQYYIFLVALVIIVSATAYSLRDWYSKEKKQNS